MSDVCGDDVRAGAARARGGLPAAGRAAARLVVGGVPGAAPLLAGLARLPRPPTPPQGTRSQTYLTTPRNGRIWKQNLNMKSFKC